MTPGLNVDDRRNSDHSSRGPPTENLVTIAASVGVCLLSIVFIICGLYSTWRLIKRVRRRRRETLMARVRKFMPLLTNLDKLCKQWEDNVGSYKHDLHECSEGLEPENAIRSRFAASVMCVNETRVTLNDCYENFYMNANWYGAAPHKYILSEAPISDANPDVATDGDFWYMVGTLDAIQIVMLGRFEEIETRDEDGSPKSYANFLEDVERTLDCDEKGNRQAKVSISFNYFREEFIERQVALSLLHDGVVFKRCYNIPHLQCWTWPEDGPPRSPQTIANLICTLIKRPGLTIVHCTDGQGRTGMFVFAIELARRVIIGQKVDPIELSLEIRKSRDGAIQNAQQFLIGFYIALLVLRIRLAHMMEPDVSEAIDNLGQYIKESYEDSRSPLATEIARKA